MKRERINYKLDAAVNKGIAAVLIYGVHHGIKIMKDNNVPVHIAARVVLSPKFRRSTDWKR